MPRCPVDGALTIFRRNGPMSCYRRPKLTGATVFFTVALAQRGSTLLVDEMGRLRQSVKQTLQDHPVTVDAWVVLPDHMHAIWTLPAGDRAYGMRWGAIKSRFSRSLKAKVGWNPTLRSASKVRKGDVGVWQRRFWEHHIRDEADYRAHLAYCMHDPVRHGLVAKPEDWPFSSIHRERRLGRLAG